MIEIKTEVQLKGVSGKKISDFFMGCTDHDYQNWWPGTHLAWHTKRRYPGNIGNVVYFDEYVGPRRLKFDAVVIKCIPGKALIWQMKKLVRLPAWLVIEFQDNDEGTILIHTIRAGFPGIGRHLDRLFRLIFDRQFEKDMDEHAHTEFGKLAAILA